MRGATAAAILALFVLQGCDGHEAAAPVELDQRLAEIYNHTCATCHTDAETGAPQAHDIAAWKPRLAQGDDVLLDHMVEGFNGMPPLGQCIECGADDLKALMHFMAAPAAKTPPEKTSEEKTSEEKTKKGDAE
ncbi:MAG: c-type cytochrome [Parvibaculum sp.]|uniref:c-type cytochrome n=1 Tax=Parvibaculum sp. TaxID=2024848 RepID=UPI002600BE56|nr:c-type cytochrome [Parvibaculum sp.]MCE9651343.1 c-type cytochrome [Parvibaculum sp.]